jgi:hypothetical protein
MSSEAERFRDSPLNRCHGIATLIAHAINVASGPCMGLRPSTEPALSGVEGLGMT